MVDFAVSRVSVYWTIDSMEIGPSRPDVSAPVNPLCVAQKCPVISDCTDNCEYCCISAGLDKLCAYVYA